MENSKIILITLLVLTLLVGVLSGYLIANNVRTSQRADDFRKLMMLKGMPKPGDRQSGWDYPGSRCGNFRDLASKTRDRRDKSGVTAMRKDLKSGMDRMHEKKGEIFLSIMAEKCGLTDKQQKQVKAVFDSKKSELEAARSEFRSKLDTIKDKTDSQIENILTDEQKDKFREFKENAKKCRMRQSMDERPAPGRTAFMGCHEPEYIPEEL
ncbi:MAG: hypothetical protein PHO00_05080 [bacterium]|nr:hypothetical protein [bacterium]